MIKGLETLKIGKLEFTGFPIYLKKIKKCYIKGKKPFCCGFGYGILDCSMRKDGLCLVNDRVACGYENFA